MQDVAGVRKGMGERVRVGLPVLSCPIPVNVGVGLHYRLAPF